MRNGEVISFSNILTVILFLMLDTPTQRGIMSQKLLYLLGNFVDLHSPKRASLKAPRFMGTTLL